MSHPKESATSDGRGEGFELRTDQWGAIRAAKGLFVGTDAQMNAEGKQLEIEIAIKRLEKALADVKDYDLNFNLSYTFNKTRQTSGPQNGIPLTDIPQHSLNGAITFAYKNVSAYLRGEFRAMQLRNNLGGRGSVTPAAIEAFKAANPGVSEYYKPYFLCHIGVGYQINKMFRLNFGIYNLFNQNFIDYIAINSGTGGGASASPTYLNNYNYVREGRRYYISLNMDF